MESAVWSLLRIVVAPGCWDFNSNLTVLDIVPKTTSQ